MALQLPPLYSANSDEHVLVLDGIGWCQIKRSKIISVRINPNPPNSMRNNPQNLN